jgi:cell division septation protein DedD
MKRTINLLALAATLALFAAPALAQTPACDDAFKTATYKKWYDNRKDHQDIAFQAAEEYIKVCPDDAGPYAGAIKKFYDAYKAANNANETKKQFDDAVLKKNYPEQMRLGKLIIAAEPDNSAAYIIMGVAGLSDPNLLNDSSQYAKKAIELIEGGKPFAPFTTKDQALAYLNNEVAKSMLKSAPADAIPYFLKAARYESDLKKSPQLYADLAGAYGEGPIAKQSAEYTQKFTTESPESKLAVDNLNQLIDRQIDALARAASLSTNPANKKALMDLLTGLYTDRNKNTTGLDTLLAGVLSKPIPDYPTPLTLPTPAATPEAAPAATPTMTPAVTPTTTPAAKPTTTPAKPTTTPAKPSPSPSPTPATRRAQ